jgi:hypothetical protein
VSKSVAPKNTPRHLIFVAGKSPLPMYQVLAMKLNDGPRWNHVDIMVNSVTKQYVEKAQSLFKEGIPEGMKIKLHKYDNPGISHEEINSLFDKIIIDGSIWTALYPGLGPRSVSISLLWRASKLSSKITTLKVLQSGSNSVIEENYSHENIPPKTHHAELPSLDDYLRMFGCSIKANESGEGCYLLNEEDSTIGLFLDIQYNGILIFNYDTRLYDSFEQAKIKTRELHSVRRELEKIFGRNAIRINSLLEKASRTNPETYLNTETLTRFTFHHFFDARNITLTCLALFQLASNFVDYQIQCYIDPERGMSVDEVKKEITKRLEDSKLSKSMSSRLHESLRLIDNKELRNSLLDSEIDNTYLHVINKSSGHVEGHISLQKHLSEISISNNYTLGGFDPRGMTWMIEPRSPSEKFISRTKPTGICSFYALAGHGLTGQKAPQWQISRHHESNKTKPNNRDILTDIDFFTSMYSQNKLTTINRDGTTHHSTLRVLNPQIIEYVHSHHSKKNNTIGSALDYMKGSHISLAMIVGKSKESKPFRMEWVTAGGIWLEGLCAILIWKLFMDSKETEILYNPVIKTSKSNGGTGQYTPEGIIHSPAIQIVWEVKSPPTSSLDWRKYISQASEYANLAPYRNTMPLLIHCDENPEPATVELAKQCKVALCAWWEIPNLREVVKNWSEQNQINNQFTDSLPQFEYSPKCVDSIETTYDLNVLLPELKMRNSKFESAFRQWFNSLSPEEQETQREDIWMKPLLHMLEENVKEVLPSKETKTIIVTVTKDELIKKIGNALLEMAPCSWQFASQKIALVSTPDERKTHFEMGATQKLVTEYFSEYVKLEGKGLDTTVHRAQPDEGESIN